MMKRIWLTNILLMIAFGITAQTAEHVIFLSIDGFRPDFYLDTPWQTPNLRLLMKDGAYARGVNSVFPSMTYPSHTTIITGVQPAKHGVYYNNIFDERNGQTKPYWYDSSIHARTIWSAAKEKGMTVASLYWPVSAGAPVDYNIPDIGGLGEVVREKYSVPENFISILKKEVFDNADKIEHGRNTNIAKIAAYVIKESKPQLMTIHVFSVDHAEHLEGREGNMVKEAVADADSAVGIIVEALQSAGIWNNTVLLIGGDHGFYNVTKTLSPNIWLKNAGLLDNAKAGEWKAQFATVGGSAYLYLKDQSDKNTEDRVRTLLNEQPDSIRRLFRIIERKQLGEGGYNPEVAFALSAMNEASFNNASAGSSVVKPGKGGTHGHYPDTKNIRTGFIAHGPGIQKGAVINEMNLKDITPIIIKLLDLSFPLSEGKIPDGLLQ